MKNNRLIYILITLLTIWCIGLTVFNINQEKQENNAVINQYEINGFSTDFTKIVDEKQASIVSINASGSISTGFVYKQENDLTYIITCYHSIADANNIFVYFKNGSGFEAKIVGTNAYADIAVLSVSLPYEIEPLLLADADTVSSGEFVISIGTPSSLEYSNSVEIGMVSNSIRTIENNIDFNDENIVYYLDVIQLSSNLKPGYSGSPILNMNGEVIGVVTMSLDERFNFAVTSNETEIIADKLIAGQDIKKYQLGIKGTYIEDMPMYEKTNLDLPVDVTYGLFVDRLMDNSVTLLAGVKTNDVILQINKTKLNNINDYLNIVYSETDAIEYTVFRNGETLTYKVNIND